MRAPAAAAIACVLAGTSVAMVLAQPPAPAAPAFDAASIKPNTSGQREVVNMFVAGGRYVATNATARQIIELAYRPLLRQQIIGGPDWLVSARYDVQAKAERNPSSGALRGMLRTLLTDRFTLRVRTETRDAAVYALVMARSDRRFGPELSLGTVDCSSYRDDATPRDDAPRQVPSAECGFLLQTRAEVKPDGSRELTGIMSAKGVTPAQIAAQLSGLVALGRIVVDRTGLPQTYNMRLAINLSGGADGAADVFTAIQEQLGLKLESTTAPVEFLVIDAIERPTAD